MKNKIKLLTAIVASSFCLNSFAATENFAGTFDTIKDVSISQITPLNLVGLALANGSACTLAASTDGTNGPTYVGDVTMNLGSGNDNAAGADIGLMSGGTCLTTATGGVMGIYEIDGASGASVKVTIVSGSNADLLIVPAGCIGDYVAGADGDACDAIAGGASGGVAGTQVTVRLAGATDTGTLGEGVPVAGKTRIVLGGVTTSQQALLAGTPYTVDFDINVIY